MPSLALVLFSLFTLNLWAGGSGLNVVIVVNQNSTNSVQLGNYYRAQRNVPPQNFLRIAWTGTNTEWTLTDFNNTLLNPLLSMLASRQLTNQIDYVVLSMDIPYRVSNTTNGYNSTTAALFYGFKNDPNGATICELTIGSTNLYAGSEGIFRSTPPTSPGSNSFLATMITAGSLSVAEMVVLQGAGSDGTFPTQTVWLGKSSDPARNVRYPAFDNAVFNTRLRGNYSVMRTNLESADFSGLILGYENGSYYFGTTPVPLFVPGAMADNLTSYGGQLFEDTAGQSTAVRFLNAGASGSYGTIIEPCNFPAKFPDPQNYFYQSRGFSLGECYYQSVTNPYQGLVLGEPLAAPFAQPGAGAWIGLGSNAVIAGVTNLSVQFTASDARHPLQQADLFLDGNWLQTVTNIPPQTGNVLNVTLNGFATTYTVPAGANIKSVTTRLAGLLNGALYANNTKVSAVAHGDRIELHSTAAYTKTGAQIPVAVSSANPSGSLTTFLQAAPASPTNFLDSPAWGIKAYDMGGSLLVNTTLTLTVTKTNNATVTVTVTNSGSANFTQFAQQLVSAISNTPSLQGPDGLIGENVATGSGGDALFDLRAQSAGYAAAQIKASFSAGLITVTPTGNNTLTDNTSDLQPRTHLYVTAGVSNLALNIPFNTTNLADGYHELAAVAYEGSHVHTQTRATQSILIQNTSLSATFTPVLSGSNSALQPTLQFMVVANTNNISAIQLFSTGGLLAAVTNQSSATFPVTLTNLNIGLHPFYAIVTDNTGRQYRTQTQSIGLIGVNYSGGSLIGVDYPFTLQKISALPPILVWPATAGRSYNILTTTNLLNPFQLRATVTPTNSLGQWTETNTSPAQQFYRLSVAP